MSTRDLTKAYEKVRSTIRRERDDGPEIKDIESGEMSTEFQLVLQEVETLIEEIKKRSRFTFQFLIYSVPVEKITSIECIRPIWRDS